MFAISTTDNTWFNFLKETERNSFVNFWTPTPWNVRNIKQGSRWYFLLKSPIRQIAGFGEFYEYKNLTVNEAWKEFGQRNGYKDKIQLSEAVQTYIDKNSKEFGGKPIAIDTYKIGCIVLVNCEYWDTEKYMEPGDHEVNFPTQVVKYKYFDQYDPFFIKSEITDDFNLLNESRGNDRILARGRKGQSAFKGKILKAYSNKCCISEETCPELLDAAHLQSYLNIHSNHVQNGILLRVDLHRLYDSGLLFINSDYIVCISPLIKNSMYWQYNGIRIMLPKNSSFHPSKQALELKKANFRQ